MNKNEFLESLTAEEQKLLFEDMDEEKFEIDDLTKKRIENKVLQQISGKKKNKKKNWKTAGIAAAIILAVSLFNPTVLAYMRNLLYFVPNVGVVEESTSEMFMGYDIEAIKGGEHLISEPIIIGNENGLKVIFRVNSEFYSEWDNSKPEISPIFTAKINEGEEIEPTYYSFGGSEKDRNYELFYDISVNERDEVEISSISPNLEIKVIMGKMKSVDIEEIAHTDIYGSRIFAQPLKKDNGYDIYMFATSEDYTTEMFNHTYPEKKDMYFLTEDGKKIDLTRPSSFGSGMMPPLTLEGNPGRGELVFKTLIFSTNDRLSYEYKTPKKNEVVELNETLQYGETEITLEKIYWDDVNEAYAIDISWNPSKNPKLFSLGRMVRGLSYSMFDSENGISTVGLDDSKTIFGRGEITLGNPEYIYKEEYRIKLNLE